MRVVGTSTCQVIDKNKRAISSLLAIDRSEPQVAKAHGLLPEVAIKFRTASSHCSLVGQTNFSPPLSAHPAKRPVGRPKQGRSTGSQSSSPHAKESQLSYHVWRVPHDVSGSSS